MSCARDGGSFHTACFPLTIEYAAGSAPASMKLEADDRFVAAADEDGASYEGGLGFLVPNGSPSRLLI